MTTHTPGPNPDDLVWLRADPDVVRGCSHCGTAPCRSPFACEQALTRRWRARSMGARRIAYSAAMS